MTLFRHLPCSPRHAYHMITENPSRASYCRGNTSVLVRVLKEKGDGDDERTNGDRKTDAKQKGGENTDGQNSKAQHIQIDTGKTWREGVIRWFPR